jgi:heptosyltransferase-2
MLPPVSGERTSLLVIKTGALGDVLRTTSILPGLAARYPGLRVTWLVAPGARLLVDEHPLVDEVVAVDPEDDAAVAAVGAELARTRWDRVLSLDDERELCALAASLADPISRPGALSGAYAAADGALGYTDDVAPWFDMGLLSRHGKERADALKVANRRSHPEIYADMLGIEMGEPELPLPEEARARARALLVELGSTDELPRIGLNTGSGGRWESKRLPEERVPELVEELDARLEGRATYVLLGGADEAERNGRLAAALEHNPRVVAPGTDFDLIGFAALVDALDLLVTSDSLALHVAIARRREVVAFFAPTSAPEIELYGRGERVASTSPDACSYRSDADTSTLTAERLAAAVVRRLAAR